MGLIGLFLIASGLLVVAGLAKAVQPGDTTRALAALLEADGHSKSLVSLRRVVRIGALMEAALGSLAVLEPRPLTAGLVALSYLAFSAVVAYAWHRSGPLATCGCFGRADTPPTAVHLLLDFVLAASAAAFALSAPHHGTILSVMAHQPWSGVPLLFAAGVGASITFLALSPLAQLEGARRLVRPWPGGEEPTT